MKIPRHTPKKAKYIEGREMGMHPTQAAKHAGYSVPSKSAQELEKDPIVMAHVAEIEEKNRKALDLSREDVLQGVMDAIEVAKLASDPQAMIRGWSEINRMLGYYEAEKRELEIKSLPAAQKMKAIESMSTEKLLEMVGGEMTIEGEWEEVGDDEEVA